MQDNLAFLAGSDSVSVRQDFLPDTINDGVDYECNQQENVQIVDGSSRAGHLPDYLYHTDIPFILFCAYALGYADCGVHRSG